MLTGRQIREAREKLGWVRNELARRAGLSTTTIARAEATYGEAVVTMAQMAGTMWLSQLAKKSTS